ncbi:hypothetical protein IFM89_023128 [Coptis chinensis]|uniref:ABC1 atypical kinase-like domain-containing protein n=1 Tax=Coptis chinensis TaxID=261450 RepID=A0A835HU91_9MAGN|nr:hypothetical protein IFM89_023128 [Coptis chinensis]
MPAVAMMPFANYFGPLFREKWIHFVYVAREKADPAFIKWGSGQVTQIHRATLRCDNPDKAEKTRVVAVKVRHPGVDESVMKDLSIVRFYANVLSSLFPTTFKSSRFDETLQQFAVVMGSEVIFPSHMFETSTDVDFPEPLYPFVQGVLVENFIEGESFERFIEGDSNRIPNRRDKKIIVHDGTLALHTTLVLEPGIDENDGTPNWRPK